jgi:hypothetical protein
MMALKSGSPKGVNYRQQIYQHETRACPLQWFSVGRQEDVLILYKDGGTGVGILARNQTDVGWNPGDNRLGVRGVYSRKTTATERHFSDLTLSWKLCSRYRKEQTQNVDKDKDHWFPSVNHPLTTAENILPPQKLSRLPLKFNRIWPFWRSHVERKSNLPNWRYCRQHCISLSNYNIST